MQEKAVLSKLQEYYARHHELPSLGAMCLLLNVSQASLLVTLQKMVSNELLRRDPITQDFEPDTHFF